MTLNFYLFLLQPIYMIDAYTHVPALQVGVPPEHAAIAPQRHLPLSISFEQSGAAVFPSHEGFVPHLHIPSVLSHTSSATEHVTEFFTHRSFSSTVSEPLFEESFELPR